VPFLDQAVWHLKNQSGWDIDRLYDTLEEHRRALLMPSWKYTLNYETDRMTRDAIVQSTYDSTVAMSWLRARHGVIPSERAREVEASIDQSRRLLTEIDEAMMMVSADRLQDTLRTLKPMIDQVNQMGQWGRPSRSAARRTPARAASERNVFGQVSRIMTAGWQGVKRRWHHGSSQSETKE